MCKLVFSYVVCFYIQVITSVQNGELLTRPALCPDDVYSIMLQCWRQHPGDRLPMKRIHSYLQELCSVKPVYIEIIG